MLKYKRSIIILKRGAQMNNNMPMIKKEGLFTKIKSWFKRLFAKEELIINAIKYSISNYFKLNMDYNSLQYIKEWGKDKSLWNKKMLIKYIHGITHDFNPNEWKT